MHNANKPTANELPSSSKLLRSTILAALGAAVILVTVVLPAEFGIDPIGVGRILGLTEVGEIKAQLAADAKIDRDLQADAEQAGSTETPTDTPTADAVTRQEVVAPTTPAKEPAPSVEPEIRDDEITIELAPGEATEVKLLMKAGEKAEFNWTANGSALNFDLHGDGDDQFISYEKGRAVAGDEGAFEAAFDGYHGWFWRNRTDANVKVTLRTSGTYLEFKRI